MSAETTLRQLFPLDLGSEHAADLAVDGRQLDAAFGRIDTLLREVFPDTATEFVTDWERVCGISPPAGVFLRHRQEAVVSLLRRKGGVSIPYFVNLAASLGFEVTIVEHTPFMAGVGQAGDTIYAASIIWQWGVIMPDTPTYFFSAGTSTAGEPLSWWVPLSVLEEVLTDLKPAHTVCYFIY